MADTQPLTPTDAEIKDLYAQETGFILDDCPAALLDFARAVLARWGQPAHSGEPFAWTDDGSTRSGAITTSHRVVTHETKKAMPRAAAESFNVPLYLAPQPVEREPLTPEQMDAALGSAKKVKPGYVGWVTDQRRELGRAVERAHGIKGGQHGAE